MDLLELYGCHSCKFDIRRPWSIPRCIFWWIYHVNQPPIRFAMIATI